MTDTLLPGKRAEFVALLRNELMPAFRKSPVIGIMTSEMAFGPGTGNWVFAVPVQNWAELDKPMPLFTSMGQQAAEALLAKADALVARSETIVLQSAARSLVHAAAGNAADGARRALTRGAAWLGRARGAVGPRARRRGARRRRVLRR